MVTIYSNNICIFGKQYFSKMLNDKIPKVLSLLNERQQRLYLAMEAEDIRRGGVQLYFQQCLPLPSNVSQWV